METCAIYFRNEVENKDLILLFLEMYLKELIKNKIITKITLIENNYSKFCLNLFKDLRLKYYNFNFELVKVENNSIKSLCKIIEQNNIVLHNEEMKFDAKKYTLKYKNRILEKIIENKNFINVNVVNFVNNIKEAEII